ncbi:hypothetical protein [Bradyrhizobium sp. AZCC 1693]|uniref:hypothetical protein n=1 Tax=Bradyrhizobium sp. AZCC 1693 TaxID=3117029 RepID=UPI002FF0A024
MQQSSAPKSLIPLLFDADFLAFGSGIVGWRDRNEQRDSPVLRARQSQNRDLGMKGEGSRFAQHIDHIETFGGDRFDLVDVVEQYEVVRVGCEFPSAPVKILFRCPDFAVFQAHRLGSNRRIEARLNDQWRKVLSATEGLRCFECGLCLGARDKLEGMFDVLKPLSPSQVAPLAKGCEVVHWGRGCHLHGRRTPEQKIQNSHSSYPDPTIGR